MEIPPNFDTRIKNCLTLVGDRIAELRSFGKLKEALELENKSKQLRLK